jgi:co-chaperonin GroES (HSP10)
MEVEITGVFEPRSFDPINLRPLGPWMLVEQDELPSVTAGGIVLPDTSTLKGVRNCVGTVHRVGSGWGKGTEKGKPVRYEMPPVGARVIYPAVASLPNTQKAIQWKGKARWFLLHAIDANAVIECEPGEKEPKIE